MRMDCPLPAPTSSGDRILLAHGSGGRLSHWLLKEIFLPALYNPLLGGLADAATGMPALKNWAFASDGHVVKPLFFPGGDIGKLAVTGTANDLAVSGARPLFLSLNWILEEGLEIAELKKIVGSVGAAAGTQSLAVVCGDTKVVERGKGDGVFISSSGVGERLEGWDVNPRAIRAGDQILVSGDLGRHGLAVMMARSELGLEFPVHVPGADGSEGPRLVSDCGPLFPAVEALWKAGVRVRAMRDLTRGGLANGAWELSHLSQTVFSLDENTFPFSSPVRGACELLGLDPLHLANEGTMAVIVAKEDVDLALRALHALSGFQEARWIGEVEAPETGDSPGVHLRRPFGGTRILELPLGDALPRIC